MEQFIEKKIFILILSVILIFLILYTVYFKFLTEKKEGLKIKNPFNKIKKAITKPITKLQKNIKKFIKDIRDFICWIGDTATWFAATVASLMYYVGNVFSGCIVFYIWDCIVGIFWFFFIWIISLFKKKKEFLKGYKKLLKYRNKLDKYIYNRTGENVFKYSDKTIKKCYKMKFEPFPKWPF